MGTVRGPLRSAAIAAAVVCPALPAEAGDGWSYYDGYSQSYTIPFVSRLDFDYADNPPQAIVNVSVNGGDVSPFQLDTGSQGMVVPADLVPDFKRTGERGSITYVSSGIKAVGYWTEVTVSFPESTDGHGNKGVASSKVKVLVATEVCDLNTDDCDLPLNQIPRMIGIGFDREEEADEGLHPSLLNNPLLHIEEMDAGMMRAGYVFRSDRIEVGLTEANAGSGFAMYKLLPTTIPGQAGKQWETLPGTFIVTRDGATTTRDLPLLLDTGIGYAWVNIGGPSSHANCPDDDRTLPATAECAAPGAEVTVYFGGSDQVGFTYTTGETDNPVAPWFTRTDNNPGGSNVGIHPIAGFDYLFDSVGGFEGLRATGIGGASVVFDPFLSMAGPWSLTEALATDLPVYVRADAEIATDATATFRGAFTGPAALTVSGAGEVVFKADVTLPAGVTVAGNASFRATTSAPLVVTAGGTATNGGTIAGNVFNAGLFANDGTVTGNVGNTGVLTGNGHIGGALVTTGVVAPGHSAGAMSVAGDARFEAGSVYVAEIGEDGEADRLDVGGTLAIAGATLEVGVLPGAAPTLGASYVVVDAGSIIGAFAMRAPDFAALSSAYPFLAVASATEGGEVALTVTRSDVAFAAAAETRNQKAVGQALDTLGLDAGVVETIVVLDARSARYAYDQLSGAIYPSIRGMFAEQAMGVRDAILARLRQVHDGPGLGGIDAPDSRALAPASPGAMWVTSYGDWGMTDATDNVAAFSRTLAGIIGGIDTEAPGSDWRLGIAGGYAHTSFAVDGYRSSGSSNGADFAAYAGGTLAELGRGALVANLGAAFGVHDVSVDRDVVYAGYSGRARSDLQATTAQAFGELAYDLDLGPTAIGVARVEPFAGLGTIAARTGSFGETGGVAALDGSAGSFAATTAQIGIRGETRLPVASASIDLGGTIGWQHVFSDPTPAADLSFAAGGAPFTVLGAPIAVDALVLGLGVDAELSPLARFGVSYLARIAADAENHAVNGTLSLRF